VAIIGGGVGGLSVALSLQRAGLPFAVFERDSEHAARWGYGMTLQAKAALRDLGVLAPVEALAEQCVSNEHWTFDASGAILGYFGRGGCDAAGEGGSGIERGNVRIPREDLLRLMREALAPGSVRFGHSLAAFAEVGGAGAGGGGEGLLRLEFEGATHAPFLASVLVGADGLRSRVRALVQQQQQQRQQQRPAGAGLSPCCFFSCSCSWRFCRRRRCV
jgi:2-polyprenyl-6-methoxyphenol hydroxylase-like FAD-dependent oxidoreductase